MSSSLFDVFKRRRGSNFALIWITPWPIVWVHSKGPFPELWIYESLQTNSKAIRSINGLYGFAEPQNAGTTVHTLYRQRRRMSGGHSDVMCCLILWIVSQWRILSQPIRIFEGIFYFGVCLIFCWFKQIQMEEKEGIQIRFLNFPLLFLQFTLFYP